MKKKGLWLCITWIDKQSIQCYLSDHFWIHDRKRFAIVIWDQCWSDIGICFDSEGLDA